MDYIKANGISGNYRFFIDDGYSGKDFERPAYQELKDAIRDGEVSTVIVKDNSRLGRNATLVQMETNIFYPEYGVRFISIDNNIDSNSVSDFDFTMLINYFNELYLKDISRKIKSAFATKHKEGKFTGAAAPMGYMKDPVDHNHLVPHPDSSLIVKLAFDLVEDGETINSVTKLFNRLGVPTPLHYYREQGFVNAKTKENVPECTSNRLGAILHHPVYLGHLVIGMAENVGTMQKPKTKRVPKEKWKITEDTHEALVTQEQFDIVQKHIASRKREPTGTNPFDNIFAGLLKCKNCGSGMRARHASNRKQKPDPIDNNFYLCGTFVEKSAVKCSGHRVEARDLHNIILADIQEKATEALNNADSLLEELLGEANEKRMQKLSNDKQRLADSRKRLSSLDNRVVEAYNDFKDGLLTERNYKNTIKKYEDEQVELEVRIDRLEMALQESEVSYEESKLWIGDIRECVDIKELDNGILYKLISAIEIEELKTLEGKNEIIVHIHYNFRQ